MKKQTWKTYVFWILLTEAVGALAAWLTQDATRIYGNTVQQPSFAPPAILFPIVWTLLYALMGFGAARIYNLPPSAARTTALRVYVVQLAFNFFWSFLFFEFQAFGAAFFWLIALWILILWMILAFYQLDPLAGLLQIPYLLWVSFAGYLTYAVWMLNR